MQPRDQEKMWGDPRSGPFSWRAHSLSEPLVLDASPRDRYLLYSTATTAVCEHSMWLTGIEGGSEDSQVHLSVA